MKEKDEYLETRGFTWIDGAYRRGVRGYAVTAEKTPEGYTMSVVMPHFGHELLLTTKIKKDDLGRVGILESFIHWIYEYKGC